ncbi:MAG: DUF1499 domain-containing protein [Desulfobacteraceae bacterium]|nr:DUF1499 domain-containing protein [Desulfobacteraceae bacterium]
MKRSHAGAGSADISNKCLPCPDSPNCVSSQSVDNAHFIEPLHYTTNTAGARRKLLEILKRIPRVHLAKVETDYIHAEFLTSIFRFVDDVTFFFPPDKKIIHVRSASRTGYYDFGENRRRVERLRARFEK